MVLRDKLDGPPLECVFTDLVGPMRHQSLVNSRYFVTLLDDFSGYSLVCFITCKSEAGERLIDMICEVEGLFERRVKNVT